jgi:D-3-phosphoglycerate dehydrogenase / 2-oxoglutarate reductase
MKRKVLICIHDNINQGYSKEIQPLVDAGFEIFCHHLQHSKDEKTVINTVNGYDYVVAGSEVWNNAVFESVSRSLKMLVRFGIGMESVEIDAATRLGIPVSNTPGGNANAVAEQTLAMILCITRRIAQYDKEMKEGIWSTVLTPSFSGKVGLIGFGAIARELAIFLKIFPVEVIVYDVVRDADAEKTYGVRYVNLDELITESDFISLHIPVTEKTKGMVDKKFLSSMKSTAFLINTSRGAIINENELIDALMKKTIAGAALDVFEKEPLPVSSLLTDMDNVLLTPHSAMASIDGFKSVLSHCVRNILDYEAGRDFKGLVNPEFRKHKEKKYE